MSFFKNDQGDVFNFEWIDTFFFYLRVFVDAKQLTMTRLVEWYLIVDLLSTNTTSLWIILNLIISCWRGGWGGRRSPRLFRSERNVFSNNTPLWRQCSNTQIRKKPLFLTRFATVVDISYLNIYFNYTMCCILLFLPRGWLFFCLCVWFTLLDQHIVHSLN